MSKARVNGADDEPQFGPVAGTAISGQYEPTVTTAVSAPVAAPAHAPQPCQCAGRVTILEAEIARLRNEFQDLETRREMSRGELYRAACQLTSVLQKMRM